MISLYRFSAGVSLVCLGATILLTASTAQTTDNCTAIEDPDFDYEVIPEDGFKIQWAMSTSAETITFKVNNSRDSWTSIGFSANGEMIGSDAVLGLPDNDTILEYNLTSKDPTTIKAFEEEDITDKSVTQEDNVTTIIFTRPLAPSSSDKETLSSTPGDEHYIIWAYGNDNEFAQHAGRGELLLDLFCGETLAAPTAGPVMVSSMSPSSETPSPVENTMITTSMAPTLASSSSPSLAPSPSQSLAPSSSPAPTSSSSPAPTSSSSTTLAPSSSTNGPFSTPAPEGENVAFRVGGSGLWMTASTGLAVMLGAILMGLFS